MGDMTVATKVGTSTTLTESRNYDSKDNVGHDCILTPKAAELISIVASANLTNKSWTLAGQPDVPRNLVCTVTDTTASITGGTIEITGTDVNGRTVMERHVCGAGTQTKTGNVAFAKVSKIETKGFTVLGGSGDELFKVGVGTKIGIACPGTLVSVFKANCDGDDDTIGTVNTQYKTIVMNTAPNGTHSYDVWFKKKSQ